MSKTSINLGRVFAVAGGLFVLLLLLFALSPGIAASQLRLPGTRGSLKLGADGSGSLNNIQNATLGFQKIFAINLPLRTDHRDQMSLAAHFTGLQIDYVDGVTEVDTRTLPPGGDPNARLGVLGSWRAHLNIMRKIVEENITSAMVFEDDTDWDIRIHSQMQDFARASRLLVQPLPGTSNQMLDPTYPEPGEAQGALDFDITKGTTTVPTTSPYGDIDRWDIFWLGHCGARFPSASDKNTPIGRAVILDDVTVPEKQHIDEQYGDKELIQQYPDHTRVVTRAHDNVCTLAYAISLPGARRVLYELGMHKMNGAYDIMLKEMCDGRNGRRIRTCLSVQPMLFQHHRPIAAKSSFSDIGKREGGYSATAFTRNIRWSTRVNFPSLIEGDTNYTDLFRDGEPRPDLHFV
ncbi:hypothetical protein LTR91_005065 [Friedmanniomyces endolithicus]|uniref:Glycosyltransferase family 25 protein n=1 Tax=Friedmanniomyces endolithicus TaxID=329885 RepID=A0AAN6QXY8_9PEZI|nr:hypothetical protein LTR94_003689 [Friedmanniomyces endolithicus]KAK0770480.1 hypothetical protein LTR59_016481 [Friedmanniomyces endolithicus]KAK0814085.1 hypothetical protein LTR38_002860 [Friedmanniomyces endolithicus]KAK0820606.1 hypothetical protein LTR75_001484 [Friedmanniomyces endolithicus]KAK0857910.1 hypothetical protein LTR03_000476 [Friedmanniomyces endolithicus]